MSAAFGHDLTRVYDRHGVGHRRALGAADPDERDEMELMLRRFRKQRRWEPLDLIIARRFTVAEIYDAERAGTLDALLSSCRAEAEPDLDPLVRAWAEDGATPRYVAQVRRLIPAGARFPVSEFRRARISAFLATLTGHRARGRGNGKPVKVSQATRDRYKAALSDFAKFLLDRELIEANPTRDLTRKRKAAPKPIVYLDPADVRRLVDALPAPYRALEALMAGTGMEWGACAQLRRQDVDADARLVYARGTKNEYRTRWVEVSEEWAWAIVAKHLRDLAPAALVFPDLDHKAALAAHHAAAAALGLRFTTLHNHRNSYAVMWIKRSGAEPERLQWLKNQLGHAPQSTLIHTTYGVFIKAARLTTAQQARLAN